MSRRKIILTILGLLIVGVVIVLLRSKSSEEILRVYVLIPTNELMTDSLHRESFITQLHQKIIEKQPHVVELQLYALPHVTSQSYLKIRRGYMQGKNMWSQTLLDSLRAFFSFDTAVVPSSGELSSLMRTFFQNVPYDRNALLVLAGSFPPCYTSSHVAKLIEELQGLTPRSGQIVLYGIQAMRKTPEERLLSFLQDSLHLKLKRLSLPLTAWRPCPETEEFEGNAVVYSIFLDRLSNTEARDFLHYVQNVTGEEFRMVIWNDGPANGSSFLWSGQASDTALPPPLTRLRKATFFSLSFLFRQCLDTLRKDTLGPTPYIFLVGHFPPYPRVPMGAKFERLVSPKEWDEFRKLNAHFLHYLPSKKPTTIDSEYVNVLRVYRKLKIETNYNY
jgi:hypothetical protein